MKKLTSLYGPPKRLDANTFGFEVMCGSNISTAIAEGISVARGLDATAQFEFNGVVVKVRSDSNPELIHRDWSRALHGYIDKNVGPHPNPVLTDKEQANDARLKAESDRRYEQESRKALTKAEAHRRAVEAKLANAPAIELLNAEDWKKFQTLNAEGYGGAVVSYSERWARLMQVEMASGKKLEDVAEATSQEADLEGITGAMYGFAVGALAKHWKFGDQLRRWHNLKYQLGKEGVEANEKGGTLNPAMLRIG